VKRLIVFVAAALAARAAVPAQTPPMGWNSWDCFGTDVRENEVKANADYMKRHLAAHGWQYVVIDIEWYAPNAEGHEYHPGAELTMDKWGRLTPALNRFPSAANGAGFKPLADYVHGLGLKFGVHILRGIPREAVERNTPVLGTSVHASDIADRFSICPWNPDMYGVDMKRPGAQAYYNSMVALYGSWGVDFIKADDEIRPMHRGEVHALHVAIEKSGRAMALSLSPGPARVEDAAFLAENANMWRVSDDFWDDWRLLRQNFTLLSIWGGMGRPGAWPDGDMLPLGRIGGRAHPRWSKFTHDEQRTLMSLWAVAQSPLIFGGNLPDNDEFTNSLLTNDEVIAVNQRGAHGREVWSSGDEIVWVSDAPGGSAWNVAVFNMADHDADLRVVWRQIGLLPGGAVRDLWAGRDLGVSHEAQTFHLPAHGSGLYRVTAGR